MIHNHKKSSVSSDRHLRSILSLDKNIDGSTKKHSSKLNYTTEKVTTESKVNTTTEKIKEKTFVERMESTFEDTVQVLKNTKDEMVEQVKKLLILNQPTGNAKLETCDPP